MRSILRAVACAAALVFVASACKAEVTRHVLIVGDSLSSSSLTELNEELNYVPVNSPEGRYLFTPDAVAGIAARKIGGADNAAAYWTAHLASVIERVDPEVWVIELGVNDCHYGTWDNWGGAVDFFLSRLPESKPVFWVNLASPKPEYQACVAHVNEALAQAPPRWPNLKIIDLYSRMHDTASYFEADRIHFSGAGKDAYAAILHETFDKAFQPS